MCFAEMYEPKLFELVVLLHFNNIKIGSKIKKMHRDVVRIII